MNRPKILIAEDQVMMLKALQFHLSKQGYDVVTAKDGKEAIEMLGNENPDLVITDLMMPYFTGWDIVKEAKKEDSNTPVMVLSALRNEDNVIRAFKLGVDDYMTKPFSPNELAARIRKIHKPLD